MQNEFIVDSEMCLPLVDIVSSFLPLLPLLFLCPQHFKWKAVLFLVAKGRKLYLRLHWWGPALTFVSSPVFFSKE